MTERKLSPFIAIASKLSLPTVPAFSDLKISHKLNLGFGVLVGLTFLVVGRNYWGSVYASRHITQTQQIRVPTALASNRAQEDLLKMSSHVRGYLITGSSDFRNDYYLSRQEFEQELEILTGLLTTYSEAIDREQLEELRALYGTWRETQEGLFLLSDQYLENRPALKQFQDEGELALLTIQASTQELVDQQALRSPSAENIELLKELASFQTSAALMGSALRGYLTTRIPDFRFEYAGKLRENQEQWTRIEARSALLTADQRQTVDTIRMHRDVLVELAPRLLEIVEGDRYREDLHIFNTQVEPLAGEILLLLDGIVLRQQQQLQDELALGRSGLMRAQWQTVLGSFFALAIALRMALLLRQKIATPIVQLTRATAEVIDGNLDVKTKVESKDEIGTLAQTFNKMTSNLKSSRSDLERFNTTLQKQKQQLESKNIQIGQALEALQTTQAQLIQSEKMSSLGQMVAGIAHEINNPVSFIHGNVACVEEYLLDTLSLIELYEAHYPNPADEIVDKRADIDLDFICEDAGRTFQSMMTGTQRIRDIVLSLRNFSRLDESDCKLADIEAGIESTLLILQHRLGLQSFRGSIELKRNYVGLPEIECYPGQLNQVFFHLIANSIDAIDAAVSQRDSDRWNPEIVVTTTMNDEEISIQIEDNGVGFEQKDSGKIFDPFFTSKPVGEGTGMGLAVCHKVVTELHQGEISCQATLGQGSCFWVRLPLEP